VCAALQRLCSQALAIAETAAAAPDADPALTEALATLGLSGGAGAVRRGPGSHGARRAAVRPVRGAGSDDDDDDDHDDGGAQDDDDDDDDDDIVNDPHANAAIDGAPQSFDGKTALLQLRALRSLAPKWLPLMCKVFLEVRACVSYSTLQLLM
jgi:hypothetical protein